MYHKDITLTPFRRVLVANRGEIAIRVFRALNELAITNLGVFSKEDKYSLFRTKADEAYLLDVNKGPIDAYLDIDNIIKIAKMRRVDAIHPGYGFLSENPDFVNACNENGIAFIGPTKETMLMMGDKISSKQIAIRCGVPTIPGTDYAIATTEEAVNYCAEIGYPVMLKASNGGGGRGMRIVNSKEEMERAFNEAKAESQKAFGSDKIFIEKYIKSPKHVEVQILGDKHGNIVHLFDRDCSVQRRHQKVVEYAPAFSLSDETRERMFNDALKLAREVKYENAGTLEFLVDSDENYYFIEMNPRIQVEHTVTEMVTGIDIVQSQILIAQGYALNSEEINIQNQKDIHCYGYSIQSRVTTENPAENFLPDTGKINVYRSGSGAGIRLDGGNAFTGAEISPYYDSLLVKVISYDRSFGGSIKKLSRSLKELRIRGVKTNVPFILNVLNNETFKSGTVTTSFIEDTPQLFDFVQSQDRATKMLEFLGNKIVNEAEKSKGIIVEPKAPIYDKKKIIFGAKDEFITLGAKGFCDKILKDDRLYVTDTTMRDAHQSLFATRMRTADLLEIAPFTNQVMENAFGVEAWGGATFDVCYRFLKESPWVRLEKLSQAMPNTLIKMLLRASNAVGYKNYPDNVVNEFIITAAKSGVDVFRIFDSLNWFENMKLPIEQALKTDKLVEGAICYTGDLSSPFETKYTLDYYVKKAIELEKMGVHIIAIKDMAGLLKPYAAKTLVKALKAEVSVPICLHTHDTTGNGVSSVLMACEGGVDIVDLAVSSMSGLTSQPCLNSVVEALKHTKRDTLLDTEQTNALSRYYDETRQLYKQFESEMVSPNTEIYKYEIPGGQYSNLLAQVKSMGAGEHFEQIKQLYKDANDLLGNIVKVTPSSKAVGDLAIFMHTNSLTKDNILSVGKNLSYPDSIVDYFMGMMGQTDDGFPKELQDIVLKGETPITTRPGLTIPPADLDGIKKYLLDTFSINASMKNVLSYALYPSVYDDYCKHFSYYSDVSKLPTHIYFNGLAKGEEITVKIDSGKYLIVKLIEISKANEQGKRTLTFEVNGSMREIEIMDKAQEVKSDRKMKADKNDERQIGSPIPGTIAKILVKVGDAVEPNTALITVEAMKMETSVVASKAGVVETIHVKEGERVTQGELIISLKF